MGTIFILILLGLGALAIRAIVCPKTEEKALVNDPKSLKKTLAVKSIMQSKHSEIDEYGFEYSITGETYYQHALFDICQGDLKSKEYRKTEALLVREPENVHDKNAVAVKIDGNIVGHVPSEDAAHFNVLLEGVSDGLTCPAEIRGGRYKRDGNRLPYRVTLKISLCEVQR